MVSSLVGECDRVAELVQLLEVVVDKAKRGEAEATVKLHAPVMVPRRFESTFHSLLLKYY